MKLTLLICLLSTTTYFSQALQLSRINDSSYVYTTFHPLGNRMFPANGFIKLTSKGAVLIDTPWDTTQFQPLLDTIKKRFNTQVVLCIATHSHDDRTAGLTYYSNLGIPTYTSLATDRISQELNNGRSEKTFYRDTLFTIGQTQVQTFYPGAGHTPDNIVIWFPKDKILFGGCFIKSTDAKDLGNLEDANTGMWPYALKNTKRTFKHVKHVIPGHQAWENKKSIKHTQRLLKERKKTLKKEEKLKAKNPE